MPFGTPGKESLALNIDSLWSGGPFESSVCHDILYESKKPI